MQRLQSFSQRVHEVIRASLDEVVDDFLSTNGIVADQRMTFMERTSLRAECGRLTRFLRLIDFVVVDTLRDLVRLLRAIAGLFSWHKRRKRRNSARIFRVEHRR